MTKWHIDSAIRQFNGEDVDPIIEKVDVHYQVGHTNASMSETKDADGKWLVALCKFSKDRFLPVGPMRPENDQLVDISGDEMEVVHDGSTYPEPHDAVIVRKDIIKTAKLADRGSPRVKYLEALAAEDGVDLTKANQVVKKGSKKVRVYMTSNAPSYGMTEFTVKAGTEVQIILTNMDNVEDLTHGFSVCNHDVNMIVNAQDTNSFTFVADKPGVHWFYCPWFCHALHLEMRGRMIVEA